MPSSADVDTRSETMASVLSLPFAATTTGTASGERRGTAGSTVGLGPPFPLTRVCGFGGRWERADGVGREERRSMGETPLPGSSSIFAAIRSLGRGDSNGGGGIFRRPSVWSDVTGEVADATESFAADILMAGSDAFAVDESLDLLSC